MGLLGKISSIIGPGSENDVDGIVAQEGFEVSHCAPEDCDACGKFPNYVKVEDDGKPMWGKTAPWDLHIIIGTGKSDWAHNITSVSDSIAAIVDSKLSKIEHALPDKYKRHGCKIKLSNSSLPVNEDGTSPILILPLFKRVNATAADAVQKICAAIVGDTADPNIEDDIAKGYILMCSHRTRDKRCGITAPIMKKQFDIELRHHDLYRDSIGDDRPGGVGVIYINHVGGHKFAANVFIYTHEHAIWMARCSPIHVKGIVEETVIGNKVVFSSLVRQAIKW